MRLIPSWGLLKALTKVKEGFRTSAKTRETQPKVEAGKPTPSRGPRVV